MYKTEEHFSPSLCVVSRIRTPKHVPVLVPRTWECVTLGGKGRLSLQNQVADPYTDYPGGSNGITTVLRRGRGQRERRRCYPLAMKLGGASRSCKRQGNTCSPKTFQKGPRPCTHLDVSRVRPNLDFNIIHLYRFEPPCSYLSVTVTP